MQIRILGGNVPVTGSPVENDIAYRLPRVPCMPTGSRGLHGWNQHASIGFRRYLPNHEFSRRIHSIDSTVAFNLGVFLQPQPQLQTSATTTTFFPSLHLRRDTSHTTPTMPRQRSAGRAPSRPTVPSRAPAAPTSQQQTRPATSYAAPATQTPHQPAPGAQAPASQGPGLFGQMASTAAYVLPLNQL